MKIKNKIIVGGLMSVVSCALVGSITGTFAWYQVSNKATVSMHGKSVGIAKNLELKLASWQNWQTKNLTWADIAKEIDSSNTTGTALDLKPLSNGANTDGKSNLNTRTNGQNTETAWWGNPEGGKDLPEASDGFIQFKFKARYVESDGTTTSYPAASLYITDIAKAALANASPDITNALRVHIDFGDTQCLFNPFDADGDEVTLSATIAADNDSSKYDWTDGQAVTYQLPQDRGSNGAYSNAAGEQTVLSHDEVKQNLKDDGSVDSTDQVKVLGTIPSSDNGDGLEITVTAWLEGFANQSDAVQSNWWNLEATVGTDMQFGFQLAAFKD